MGRPYRLEFPGATYYVTARAKRRECLFHDDADYWRFIAWLGAVCTRYGWHCHAYSLLPTRYALLLETRDANLARGMRQLNGVYSQSFNRRYALGGALFLGRYTAQAFDSTRDLLKVARHVLRAPVLSGLCRGPEQWSWSSYAAVLDDAAVADWLITEPLLAACAVQPVAAREAFRRYMAEQDPRPEWPTFQLAASPRERSLMRELVEGTAGESHLPYAMYQRPPSPALAAVVAKTADPKIAMRIAYATGHFSLKQIAAYFGVHYSTVSRTVGRTPMLAAGVVAMHSL